MEAVEATRGLAGDWLVAPVPEGLVLVGERVALDVPLPGAAAAAERLAPLLVAGADLAAIAEAAAIEPHEARELAGTLAEAEPPGRAPGPVSETAHQSLAAALTIGGRAPTSGPFAVIATADEILLIPGDLDAAALRTLLHDFVAGLRPVQRRRAYCHAIATGRPTVLGDAPSAAALAVALGRSNDRNPDAIHILDLRNGGETALTSLEVGAIGAERPHRLGTVLRLAPLGRPAVAALGLAVVVADHALADPTRVEPPTASQQTKGVAAEREAAELIARAEAAERYAAGDRATVELRRAAGDQLDGAVAPDRLYAPNARQREREGRLAPYDPTQPRSWVAAQALGGGQRWVPAEAVLCPFDDGHGGGHALLGTSSGLAAGRSLEEAIRSGLRELIERDAFAWTWVQRISRERIAPASLPASLHEAVVAVESHGLEVDLVNLTLETDPVLLCAVHGAGSLTVGAGCDRDPVRAATSAFHEAAVTRLGIDPPEQPVVPEDVRSPADHEALYRLGPAAERAGHLFSSEELIDLDQVAGSSLDVEDAIAAIGEPVAEPLAIDLSSPRTRPFSVARALVPGLTPISFGYDLEPLGMELLARPRRTADGRTLGAHLDLRRAGPLTPHPFA